MLSQGEHLDSRHLTLLVGGMVAIPIVTGAIGVAQTWQSNLIGQQVMHDLRAVRLHAPAAAVAGVLHAHPHR